MEVIMSNIFPVVVNQRFFPVRLNELVDKDSYMVQEFVKNRNHMDIARDILMMVRYPLDRKGQPDDEHKYSAYSGIFHYNKTIKWDYWDEGKEVLGTLVADCEGSSICFVSCMRAKDVSEKDVYEVFGYVTKENGEFLGGHGYAFFRLDVTEQWRLYESTLDIPPVEYPVVPDIRKPFHYHGVVYHPEQLFNDKVYEEVKTVAKIGNLDLEKRTNFFMDRKCKKRRVMKHLLIGKAFNRHSRLEKAINHSIIGKLRFRKLLIKINNGG